jgi:bifunctional non-homologous end joining protein LigD
VKVKNIQTQEVVIGGWRPGKGRRAGTVGSLLMGLPDEHGLRYVGQVGTGFTDSALHDMAARLQRLARKTSPFSPEVPRADARDARWVRPVLVGEVAFSEWTAEDRLRHPSWRGLREDKSADEVVREG